MFKNILVPFDLSNQSTRAFKVALDIAKKYDSRNPEAIQVNKPKLIVI